MPKDGETPKSKSSSKKQRSTPKPEAAQPELLDVDQLLDFDPEEAPVPTPAAPQAAPPSASKRLKKALKPGAGNKAKRSEAEAAAADAEAVETPPAAKRAKTSKADGKAVVRRAAAAAADSSDDDDAADEKSIRQHRAQLESLAERDPDFYAYLKETDEDLLAFGGSEDDSSDAEEAGSDASEDEAAPEAEEVDEVLVSAAQAAAKSPGGLEVTEAVAEQVCEAAKANASLGSMHQLLKVYRAACHYSDSEAETDMALRITSSRAFNRIMVFTLREADGLLRRMLGNEDAAADKATDVTRLPRWRKVEPLAKSYLGNTLHILGNMTNASMQAFILRRLRPSAMFLRPFEKLTRKLLKAALGLFGAAEDNAVRVQAILFIRQVAIVLPQPALDMCLKGVIRTFSANAKFSNASTAAHLSFMATCIVELFGLDEEAAYSHAFTAIKDLAVTLRGALSMKDADAFRSVYCWQTVRCLELWSRVLAEHAPTSELRALVYPLVQVLLGAARLVPAPRYFPLRLRLARALHRLAASANVLVPLSPLLLEMLQWSDLSKTPQAATGQPPDMQLALRVSKSALRTSAFQEEVVTQVLQVLAEHLDQWSCSVAFPELAHLTSVQLRSLAKSLPAERFRAQAKAMLAAIERNSAFVGRARDAASFSPKDLAATDEFLTKERTARKAPMQQYSDLLTQRLEQRQAMRSTQSMPLGRGAAGRRQQASNSEDEDSDADGEAEAAPQRRLPAAKKAAKKQRPAAEQQEELPGLAQLEADTELLNDYHLSDDDEDFMAAGSGFGAAAPAPELNDDSDGSVDGDGGSGGSDDEDFSDGSSEGEEAPARRPKAGGGAPAKGSGGGKQRQQLRPRGGIGKKKAKGKVRGRDGGKGKSTTNPNKQKPRQRKRPT